MPDQGGIVNSPDALNATADGTWTLELEMPSGAAERSRCVILRDESGLIVVDPGCPTDRNWETLLSAIGYLGAGTEPIALVVATHMHPDHIGLADRLRAHSGSRLALGRIEATAMTALDVEDPVETEFESWGAPASVHEELRVVEATRHARRPVVPDLLLDDGDRWWGGCAWDSFGISAALKLNVCIDTACPHCGESIRVRSGPVSAPDSTLAVRFPRPAVEWWDDVVGTCTMIRMFCNRDHAAAWTAGHDPNHGYITDALTVWRLSAGWYGDRLDESFVPHTREHNQQLLDEAGLTGSFWRLP